MSETFRSHGKLLLTGEYAVLDGAEALGLPTRLGQTLNIMEGNFPGLSWKSLDPLGGVWFETEFRGEELRPEEVSPSGKDTRGILLNLLRETVKLNPEFRFKTRGYQAVSQLEFPREWGLGSSSTLINNLAQWAEVDPFTLLWNAFGGSGYDIACARATGPLMYKIEGGVPVSEPIAFNPPFRDRIYFVYLNRKQSSREAIARYGTHKTDRDKFLERISGISRAVSICSDWEEFRTLLLEHEELLSGVLKMDRIQQQLFPDFEGIVKSLGAWGGDFVLAAGDGEVPVYFRNKGYHVILPYGEMVL